MENSHNIDMSKQNNNSSCCTPNQNADSNCCPPAATSVEEKKVGLKKRLGFFLMGLALVFAISSAFKTASNTNGMGVLPPSIEDFEWMETDKKAAYVLVKGANEEQNQRLSSKVTEVILELNDTGDSVEYYELNATLGHYDSFIEAIGIEKTPTVVVLGRGGNLSLLDNQSASSINLYKAYVAATTPATSCNPAACAPSTACKPTKDCNPSKTCTPAQKAACVAKKNQLKC